MRDYGKVHSSFWSSDDMRSLSEDARTLAIYLLTCPHGTIAGVFRLPDGYVCEDIQWTAQRVAKGFTELLTKGFANRCESTKWVWICKHLEWNPPENPNQRKAALKIANQIPRDCSWIAQYIRICSDSIGWESPPKIEPLPNGYETVSEPVAVAVAGTVAVIEPTVLVDSKPPTPIRPDCPYVQIADCWNRICQTLPKIKKVDEWAETRRRALRSRWLDKLKLGKYNDESSGVEYWKKLFEYIEESDFLCGRNSDWRADFDWVVNPTNLSKIIEGKYENKSKQGLAQ